MPSPLNCSTARKLGPGWGLVAALGVALVLVACDPFATGSVGVSVTGSVVTTSGIGIDNARVTLLQDGSAVGSTSVDARGRYAIDGIDPGSYTVKYSAPGYTDSTFEITADQIRRLGRDTLRGPAVLQGRVVDGQTGEPVSGATVEFAIRPAPPENRSQETGNLSKKGLRNIDENIDAEFQTRTGEDGTYEISGAPTGSGTQIVTGSDYFRSQRAGIRLREGENTVSPAGLSSEMEGEELRIVVSWGETPADLDAHLTGPGAEGDRFHVAYFRKEPADAGAILTNDDKDGFGPETITIQDPRDGLYRYSVHNFSDPSRDGASGIAGSAKVTLYSSEGQIAFYSAPLVGSVDRNTWRVFEVIITDGDLTLSDNFGVSLGYFQAGGPQDVTTFSHSGDNPFDPSSASKPPLPPSTKSAFDRSLKDLPN